MSIVCLSRVCYGTLAIIIPNHINSITIQLQEKLAGGGGGSPGDARGGGLDKCELHDEKLSVYCWTCSKCICHQVCLSVCVISFVCLSFDLTVYVFVNV